MGDKITSAYNSQCTVSSVMHRSTKIRCLCYWRLAITSNAVISSCSSLAGIFDIHYCIEQQNASMTEEIDRTRFLQKNR